MQNKFHFCNWLHILKFQPSIATSKVSTYILYKMHAIISANQSMQAQKVLHTLQKFNTKQLGDLFQKQKIKRSLWNLCAVYPGLKIRRSKQHITRVIQTTTHSSSVQTGTSKALGALCKFYVQKVLVNS